MGALDLQKVAVNMGRIIKALDGLSPLIRNGNDVYGHKEELCAIAFMCRIGILDYMEKNTYMNNRMLSVRVPMGLFRSRKETMESGLFKTIGRLKDLASADVVTENHVAEILDRKELFYEFERSFPEDIKKKL